MEKICAWCGEKFESKNNTQYCSNPHFKKCDNPNCQNTFQIKEMKRPAKTCSKKCATTLTKINTAKIEKNCQWKNCNNIFYTIKKNTKYCHEKHYDNCVVCGKKFEIYNIYKPSQTCSKKCAWNSINNVSEIEQKRLKTLNSKYGVFNISQVEEIKEKKKKASLEKYGVVNVSQAEEVKEKRQKTFQKNYHVSNPMKNKNVQEKLRKTIIEKYGCDNVFANKDVQEKIKNKLVERYGVDNISKLSSTKQQVKKTTLIRFGSESVLSLPENQIKAFNSNKNRISKINKKWHEKLFKEFNIDFCFEKLLADHLYADLAYGDVGIDINPTITHNSSQSFVHITRRCTVQSCNKNNHQPLPKLYHQQRALNAQKNNKILLQYFDWFDEKIFLSILRSQLHLDEYKIGARETVLQEISQAEANKFFKINHLNGSSNKQTICLGLFYEGDLVHCQTYGKSRFNKNYEWEAIRSCSKMNYHIQGAFSKCDKYFFNHYQPQSVISYVDLSISNGNIETMFNNKWKLLHINQPSIMWVNLLGSSDKPLYIKDSAVRRLSADKMLGLKVGEKYPRYDNNGKKITNETILINEGYVKLYDCGTKTFVWQK